MARVPSFPTIPTIPQQGLTDWEFRTLNAMRENIELLTGARTSVNAAVTRGSIGVGNVPAATLQRVTAEGIGFTIQNVSVPSLNDYTKLVSDVQQLTNDVAALRQTLNTLVSQLRGQQ